MKTKVYLILMVLLSGLIMLGSCKKDPVKPNNENDNDNDTPGVETVTFSIQVTSDTTNMPAAYTEFKAKFEDLRTLEVKEAMLDETGKCELSLDKGNYTITVEWKKGNVAVFGIKENYAVTKDETVEIPITLTIEQPEGLVIKEIFFNGETNNGQKMHPDQYLVLFNNGDETVYADGVTFATTAHANPRNADIFTAELPDNIIVAQLYSIPGNGFEYPIEPGEQIVVACTAINHNAEYPNSADLSGADFEIYDPDMPAQFGTDVDNPDVPNLIAHFSYFGFFAMHPRGFMPTVIFKPDTDMETFMSNHKFEFVNSEGETKYVYSVPTNLVLDGIETGNEGFIEVKALPLSVDKGSVTVTGCHQRQLIQRKQNGTKLMDTNDSSVDCERVQGQNSFPAEGSGKFLSNSYNPVMPHDCSKELDDMWNILK